MAPSYMKAPTSLLILPPELLINPLPPSFLHIPPLHFFTLTLLYPLTPLTPLTLLTPLTPLTPLSVSSRASCPRCSSRTSISCVSSMLLVSSMLPVSCASHPMRLFVSFHLARLCLFNPLSNSKYSKRSTHITT